MDYLTDRFLITFFLHIYTQQIDSVKDFFKILKQKHQVFFSGLPVLKLLI